MNSRSAQFDFKKMRVLLPAVFFLLTFLFIRPEKIYAADYTEDNINISYSDDSILIITTGHTEVYYCIAPAGTEPKNWVWMDKSDFSYSGDSSSISTAVIDISTMNKKTKSVIYVKDSADGSAVQKDIIPQELLKVSYTGSFGTETADTAYKAAYADYSSFTDETGYIRFTSSGADFLDLGSIEWKLSPSGDFQPLSELNLEYYKALGAILIFRINTGDELISNEVKIRVNKQTIAPNVKIDGNKLTISLKDTMEYRVQAADGSYGDWTDPVFAEGKTSGSIALEDLEGMTADGIVNGFPELFIQVRNKITEKKFASRINTIDILASDTPEEGADGISVSRVNIADISGGLLIKNNSDIVYQVAVIDKSQAGSVSSFIDTIDLNAKSGETGYVKLKSIKAGQSIKVAYSSFSSFADSYAVIYRIDTVKEDKNTNELEFRLASQIKGIGGDIPVADVESGTFLIESGQTVEKTVNFTVAEGLDLYVSVDQGAYSKNTAHSVTFSGSAGDVTELRAYTVNPDTGDKSDTIYLRYQFIADGELSVYKNEWGYNLCKQLDAADGINTRTTLYQRIYLAYSTYAAETTVSDLGVKEADLSWIVSSVRIDNPELLQAIGTYTYYRDSSYNITKVVLNMRVKSEVDTLLAQSNVTAAAIVQKITDTYGSDATKIQKVKVVHDYLIQFKEYGASSLDQTMAAMLVDGYTPVCMSYALATEYVLEMVGVQSVIIFGNAGEAHAWNIINYGDEIDFSTMKTLDGTAIDPSTWYEMDVTWDDPLNMPESYIGYTYFNITTDKIDDNHTRTTQVYPSYPVDSCVGTTYSYTNCVTNNLFN